MRISEWISDVCSSDLRDGGNIVELVDRRADALLHLGPDVRLVVDNAAHRLEGHPRIGRHMPYRHRLPPTPHQFPAPRASRPVQSVLLAPSAPHGQTPSQRSEEHTSELQSLMRN